MLNITLSSAGSD